MARIGNHRVAEWVLLCAAVLFALAFGVDGFYLLYLWLHFGTKDATAFDRAAVRLVLPLLALAIVACAGVVWIEVRSRTTQKIRRPE